MHSISVIIATCGRPERLRRCLERVRAAATRCAQLRRVIVADNHPERAGLAVAREFAGAGGVEWTGLGTPVFNKCLALNTAIGRVENGWLAFTDDDTLPDDDWLRAGLAFADAGAFRVFAGRIKVGEVEGPVPWHLKGLDAESRGVPGGVMVRYDPSEESGALPGGAAAPLGANVFVRREVFAQHGGYNERLWAFLGRNALGVDDGEFGIRLLRAREPIGYCREAVVEHPCYADKYSLRRRLRNVYAYGWRNPILYPETAQKGFPWFLFRRIGGKLKTAASAGIKGDASVAVAAVLEAVRSWGTLAAFLSGAPRRAPRVSVCPVL